MATGWWASLWAWGRPVAQHSATEASRDPDRVPDDGPRPDLPDVTPARDETAPH
jgi:hypothetical protein